MRYTLRLDISPVPAARPKLARKGRVYYPKTYADFRSQVKHLVPGAVMASGIGGPLKGYLFASVSIVAKRPQKTTLEYPKPDVDNYAKAVLDCLNGWAYQDDTQIIGLLVSKEWSEPGKDGHITIEIQDGIETTGSHIMRELRQQ